MKKNLIVAILMTVATTVLLGVLYPLIVTVLAQVLFHDKANGQLIYRDGQPIGSRIIAQPFTGPEYFHPRASAAGAGYDAANSGGTNLGPTNQKLITRIQSDVKTFAEENPGQPIPVDMVTTSASGLDPDITPASAYFQASRVAKARGLTEQQVGDLVTRHIEGRSFGVLGEPRVNVLGLNLALDQVARK